MRKLSLIAILAMTVLLLSATAAFANFGPHGGYAQDTDACAGCHRAHTSFSEVTWTDNADGSTQRSALLVSNASTMSQFCYACHGDAAPGAGTNVQSGVFDSGPTTEENAVPAGALMYSSNSSYDATLNGGGFDRIGGAGAVGKPVLSTHGMDAQGLNAPTWGDIVNGNGTPGTIAAFRCTSCHDPHGSSNYRLLKDVVNGRTVGGYDKVTPDPYVISNEEGYPQGGWKRGTAGVGQMANYRPNYTTPEYAQLSGRSMSKWCAACHTAYIIENDASPSLPVAGAGEEKPWTYSAAGGANYEYPGADGSGESLYNADHTYSGVNQAAAARHRHPIDVSMAIGQLADGARGLTVKTVDDPGLPLEMPYSDAKTAPGSYTEYHTTAKPWDPTGNITCLTCHRAHGTEAAMSGWARSELSNTALRGPQLNPAREGVNPNFSEALLRYDNRGVCERCHDK